MIATSDPSTPLMNNVMSTFPFFVRQLINRHNVVCIHYTVHSLIDNSMGISRVRNKQYHYYIIVYTKMSVPLCVRACVRACVRSFMRVCARACVRACVFVYTPPPFRHDRRTATKFGTHIRIDMGLIQI